MKTEYKYIKFTFNDKDAPLKGGFCINKRSKTTLGFWDYYAPWKQYVIEFLEDCVFNTTCLKDIVDFLGQLNKAEDKDNGKNTNRPG